MNVPKLKSKLELHGAAASSSPHSLITLPSKNNGSILYASNCIVNIAKPIHVSGAEKDTSTEGDNVLYNVNSTLRTCTVSRKDCLRSITTMTLLQSVQVNVGEQGQRSLKESITIIACAFSDGTLTLWRQMDEHNWEEHVLVGVTNEGQELNNTNQSDSITDVEGICRIKLSEDAPNMDQLEIIILTSSSMGVQYYKHTMEANHNDQINSTSNNTQSAVLATYPTSCMKLTTIQNQLILAIGTAMPRHNRIHFYTLPIVSLSSMEYGGESEWTHQGSLLGHLGWVNCLDWMSTDQYIMLASGSQDARIRLWKFHSPNPYDENQDDIDDSGDDGDDDDDDEREEQQQEQILLLREKEISPIHKLNENQESKGGRHGGRYTTKNVPYTRSGDKGTSVLLTGERRTKDDDAFEAMGTVDELCSVVGVAHAELSRIDSQICQPSGNNNDSGVVDYGELNDWLLDIMSRLFDLGSHVAKPRKKNVEEDNDDTDDDDNDDDDTLFEADGVGGGFDKEHIDILEDWIDILTEVLPELTSFVLPTGGPASAQLHVARCVCRRAERRVLPLVRQGICDPNALQYLNRLSDFLFTAARWTNYCEGREEIQYMRHFRGAKQRGRVTISLRDEKKKDF
mmetsp:Transcript_19221/g.21792  ORF Transcript_19221/g.21792 Transcript_19221/m.21792 type:complete len:626 (-) Transcript_19221:86-1963(-)